MPDRTRGGVPAPLPMGALLVPFTAALLTAMFLAPAHADEGMWLFNKPPVTILQEKYGFEASPEWYQHIQRASVRFSTGGSGVIVSGEGLVATNHHVGSDMLEKLSTAERNLLADGFTAKTRADEEKGPGLELLALWTIEDITDRVKGAAAPDASAADAEKQRRKEMAVIEKQAEERTGLDCKVVTLYQGGVYHLYQYRRYDDVRLVWAPEQAAAFFGGDTDNFEYPRFCLDACLFRIYQDGEPLKPEHHLPWSSKGCQKGDLVFVSGNPASTNRHDTLADLRFQRDYTYPTNLQRVWRREVQLHTFSARSPENRRIAMGDLFGTQNRRKANTGTLSGLYDPGIMQRKAEAEQRLRKAVMSNPEYKEQWGDAWDIIEESKRILAGLHHERSAIRPLWSSDLFRYAMTLVRLAEELPKDNSERLPEFRDSAMDTVKMRLFSPAPMYAELEQNRLWSAVSWIAERLGGDHELTQQVLAGHSPLTRVETLVAGSKLFDPAERRRLFEGGKEAIAASDDTMILFARQLDARLLQMRKQHEDEVEARELVGYTKLAKAAFATYGDNVYPDATFTPRLAFGTVRGYQEGDTTVPAFTTLGGTYTRAAEHAGEPGFTLPERWRAGKDKLDLSTPYNFVTTCDIIGGNSGSPTIDRNGEVVGLIFDGNLHSLVFGIAYSDERARAVSVDSRAVLEALAKLYDAEHIVKELTGPQTFVPGVGGR